MIKTMKLLALGGFFCLSFFVLCYSSYAQDVLETTTQLQTTSWNIKNELYNLSAEIENLNKSLETSEAKLQNVSEKLLNAENKVKEFQTEYQTLYENMKSLSQKYSDLLTHLSVTEHRLSILVRINIILGIYFGISLIYRIVSLVMKFCGKPLPRFLDWLF